MSAGVVLNNETPQSVTVRFKNSVSGFLTGALGREIPLVDRDERGSVGSHLKIPGTATRVTAGRGQSILRGLEQAEAAAEAEGTPLQLVISARQGRSVADALAVMPLASYAHLLSLALSKKPDDA